MRQALLLLMPQTLNPGPSLLQQPGPKKFKLSKIELLYKAKKFKVPPFTIYLPLVGREWKNGSNSSYNCTPFLHSLLTTGKSKAQGSSVSTAGSASFSGLPCGGKGLLWALDPAKSMPAPIWEFPKIRGTLGFLQRVIVRVPLKGSIRAYRVSEN